MSYAIIKSGSKQYKVALGQTIQIDKIEGEPGKSVVFNDILLFVDDSGAQLGAPTLEGATVKGTIIDQVKGDKIRVAKFKAKAKYRKVNGFRAQLTNIKIDSITKGGKN